DPGCRTDGGAKPCPPAPGAGPDPRSALWVIVLDTTLLVYALGEEHTLRAPSRGLLELIRDGEVRPPPRSR
ncbi:MAG: hypothetical protein ACREN7_08310, partial [Candidatus Dormibacteria bacterium]